MQIFLLQVLFKLLFPHILILKLITTGAAIFKVGISSV